MSIAGVRLEKYGGSRLCPYVVSTVTAPASAMAATIARATPAGRPVPAGTLASRCLNAT